MNLHFGKTGTPIELINYSPFCLSAFTYQTKLKACQNHIAQLVDESHMSFNLEFKKNLIGSYKL